jgi:hypothetical protein
VVFSRRIHESGPGSDAGNRQDAADRRHSATVIYGDFGRRSSGSIGRPSELETEAVILPLFPPDCGAQRRTQYK